MSKTTQPEHIPTAERVRTEAGHAVQMEVMDVDGNIVSVMVSLDTASALSFALTLTNLKGFKLPPLPNGDSLERQTYMKDPKVAAVFTNLQEYLKTVDQRKLLQDAQAAHDAAKRKQ